MWSYVSFQPGHTHVSRLLQHVKRIQRFFFMQLHQAHVHFSAHWSWRTRPAGRGVHDAPDTPLFAHSGQPGASGAENRPIQMHGMNMNEPSEPTDSTLRVSFGSVSGPQTRMAGQWPCGTDFAVPLGHAASVGLCARGSALFKWARIRSRRVGAGYTRLRSLDAR